MADIVSRNSISNDNEEIVFTKSQQKAVDGIIDFIAQPFSSNDFVRSISGAGGTGKTFITDYIIRHCKFSNSIIRCAAPTHKACRVLSNALKGKKVDTIQSLLGLRLNLSLENFDPVRPQFDPIGKNKLQSNTDYTRLLIVDEASMIPSKLYNYLLKVCRGKQCKVITIGDASQLSPVNERRSIAFANSNDIYFLKEIVRQEANNPITDLLKIIRDDIKNKTYRFIDYLNLHPNNFNEIGEGYTVVPKNQFVNIISREFNNPEYVNNIDLYRVIAYTNVAVSGWNNYVRNIIVKDAYKSVLTKNDLVMSYKNLVDEFNSQILINSEEYIVKDISDFVDQKYGFHGIMIKFQAIHGGKVTPPILIINHKHRDTLIKYYTMVTDMIKAATNEEDSYARTKLWRKYYDFKNKYLLCTNILDKNDINKIVLERDIDYGFAITAHKSQGSTYENVFVDLNDMLYDKNGNVYTNVDDVLRRVYVAFSRAKHSLIISHGG